MNKKIESAIQDHDWLLEGLTSDKLTRDFSKIEKSNNIKPELEHEWGLTEVTPIFTEDKSMVHKSLKAEQNEKNQIVSFARDLMNRGMSASVVDRELKAKFDKGMMKSCVQELKTLFDLDGIVGRFVIDARGYESCDKAIKSASNSPYKRFIKYVMGCSCGDPIMIPISSDKQELIQSTGNATDDFFSEGEIYESKMVPHCSSTRIPLYESSIDELDEEWENDMMIAIGKVSGLPKDRIGGIKNNPLKSVQSAFKMLDRMAAKKQKEKYADKIDVSSYVIDTSEQEIELSSCPEAEIDVDPVNHAIQHTIEADPESEKIDVGNVDMIAEMTDVELASQAEKQLDGVELSDAGRIRLFSKKKIAKPIDVDPTPGDFFGHDAPSLLASVETDFTVQNEGIFAGCDEIELDTISEVEPELDIDIRSGFEW